MKLDNFLTVSEISKISGKSENQIRRLCREGDFACKKIGTVWFINELSFQAFWSIYKTSKMRNKNP